MRTFRELMEKVAFLGAMNKRFALFYRGQTHFHDPIPMIFREKSIWTFPDSNTSFDISSRNRKDYWEALPAIGRRVYEICHKLGLPRPRGLRDIQEVQWAVIQHYQLWPTPLIDLSSSLRIAAAFAMNCKTGTEGNKREGYLYVVGMPRTTGSITFDIDQHIVLASLSSACPPVAKRPHYQEGYLVGHFPLYNVDEYVDEQQKERLSDKCRLVRRLIAKFKLIDEGNFWDREFPLFSEECLYPKDDPLREYFLNEFRSDNPKSICSLARPISDKA